MLQSACIIMYCTDQHVQTITLGRALIYVAVSVATLGSKERFDYCLPKLRTIPKYALLEALSSGTKN